MISLSHYSTIQILIKQAQHYCRSLILHERQLHNVRKARIRAPNSSHNGYVAIVSELHICTLNYEVSSIDDVKPDEGGCFPGNAYPIQLNRVERVRFEDDLQGLENRHFHRCLSLRGGAVMQQLWPPEVRGLRSRRCFPDMALVQSNVYYQSANRGKSLIVKEIVLQSREQSYSRGNSLIVEGIVLQSRESGASLLQESESTLTEKCLIFRQCT